MEGVVSVLLMDDDSVFTEIISHKLEQEGMRCLYAPEGTTGLAMLRQGPCPSVILLDVTMPGMDGFEVLRQIKSDSTLASVPVIMFSNDFTDENVKRSRDLGAAFFLEKVQVTPGQVVEAIHKALH